MEQMRPNQSQQGFRRIVASGASDSLARHARKLQARPRSIFHQRIAVANAAGRNLDPHPTGGRLGNFTFNNFKLTARTSNLHRMHCWLTKTLSTPSNRESDASRDR